MNFKSIIYIIFIIVLISMGPLMLLFWYQYIEPNWGTQDVVKAVRQIERGQKITENDVVITPVKTEDVVIGVVTSLNQIVGKESSYLIRQGQQIIPEMIDLQGVVPNLDQLNAPVPTEWVYAYPQSLLRGDKVSFYPIKSKNKTANTMEFSIPLSNADLLKEIVRNSSEPVLEDVAISYAKSGSNQEVTADPERLKPTGKISDLEVIVTKEQWKLLVEYSMKGYQFIIMYR